MELVYSSPAKEWVEALPLGNGRLGAMVYGDYKHEIIPTALPTSTRSETPSSPATIRRVRSLPRSIWSAAV